MPWKETCTVELREALVSAMVAGEVGVAELCRLAGVSRKTAYKWLGRYRRSGLDGLVDRSRARHTQPDAVAQDVLAAIVRARHEHPTWGVKKLLPLLGRTRPDLVLPCASTASEILRRAGLSVPRPRTRRHRGPHNAGTEAACPNAMWTIDFKGQFRLGDRQMCYPLTVADRFSRYLLCVDARPGTHMHGVVRSLQRLFEDHGLPERMRSDNGSPFAGTGLGRLSRLGVWLMSHGIEIEQITPGKPGQNGRHERMHRTLKAETTRPPSRTMPEQQERFDGFRREYNQERPHEALGQRPPASLYASSTREYRPDRQEPEEYPGHYERRRVRSDGTIKWLGQQRFIAEPLAGRVVGLVETDEDVWSLHYRRTLIGIIDARGGQVRILDPLRRPGRQS
ncbi:MAG: IS481 family transposase [Planctomyces sp.]|jgi:putative transposase